MKELMKQWEAGLISNREFIAKAIYLIPLEAPEAIGPEGYINRLDAIDIKVDNEYYGLAWDIFKS